MFGKVGAFHQANRSTVTTPPNYIVGPLDAALRLLGELRGADEAVGLTVLAGRAGLAKTTALRYLRTFEARGYVVRDASGRYTLGPSVLALGSEAVRDVMLRGVARPALERLHDAFAETVNLGVPRGKRVHYLDMVRPDPDPGFVAEPGDADCLHCTALGKALLAYMMPEARDAHLKARLPRLTERTITDRRTLDRSLGAVRRFGYAIEREENEVGCVCWAAPILHGDVPIGAISLSAPLDHVSAQLDLEIPEAVKAEAMSIARQLGAAAAG